LAWNWWSKGIQIYLFYVVLNLWPVKLLSEALLTCHLAAASAGYKFALEEFTSSHNHLEDKGA